MLSIFSFEFIKSVGNKITSVKLAEGQETNARVVRHISGSGPVYICCISDIDDEIDEVNCKVSKLEVGNLNYIFSSIAWYFSNHLITISFYQIITTI